MPLNLVSLKENYTYKDFLDRLHCNTENVAIAIVINYCNLLLQLGTLEHVKRHLKANSSEALLATSVVLKRLRKGPVQSEKFHSGTNSGTSYLAVTTTATFSRCALAVRVLSRVLGRVLRKTRSPCAMNRRGRQPCRDG